jgi:hypothetical protein
MPRLTIFDLSCALLAPSMALVIRDDGLVARAAGDAATYTGIAFVVTLGVFA